MKPERCSEYRQPWRERTVSDIRSGKRRICANLRNSCGSDDDVSGVSFHSRGGSPAQSAVPPIRREHSVPPGKQPIVATGSGLLRYCKPNVRCDRRYSDPESVTSRRRGH
jgi:hypothetical protein